MKKLTRSQARRIALKAQGLHGARPDRSASMRDVQRVIDQVALFQLDSINVTVRAHYMPLFSRLGAYEPALLERAFSAPPRRLVEFWGHAASFIDARLIPALAFRREREEPAWVQRLRCDHPGLLEQVLETVEEQGALTARGVAYDEGERSRDNWGWNWSAAKIALEWLFSTGVVSSAGRNSQFERIYDLTSRVLPPDVLAQPAMTEDEQRLELARRTTRALGVFTEGCVAAYFMTRKAPTRVSLAALEAAGEIERVEVDGWKGPTWQVTGTTVPRRATGRALLSPFDSMMFHRDRIHELFDYFYRIEIYVPEAQRQYGYYVYSFLLGEEFVARLDLKADRKAGRLLVQSAWLEPGRTASPEVISRELATELQLMAGWLGLSDVEVVGRGSLAEPLSVALSAAPSDDEGTLGAGALA